MIGLMAVSVAFALSNAVVDDDAAPEPAVFYVLSVPRDRRRPVELVRFVDGRIAERSPLGDDRAFDFGRDGNWLAIVYHSPSEGRRASLWDLATGKRRADNPLTGPEIVSGHRSKLQHPHAVLILDPTGNKAVVSDGYDCGSIDLLTGKRTAFKPPGRAFGNFIRIKSQIGLRLKSGEFAPYLVETDSFGEPVRFEGIAAKWTSYIPGVGLTCNENVNGKHTLMQLSDNSLQPLTESRPVSIAHPGRQIFGELSDRHQFFLFYTPVVDGKTTVVIEDLQTKRELLNQAFEFEPNGFQAADDGRAFLMVDRNHRALYFNRLNQKTTLVDYSILREPNPDNERDRETWLFAIPFFGKAQLPEKGLE